MKHLHVTMPDGSVWAVPADLVASYRARHYANKDIKIYKEELEYTLNNPSELIDWAANNMNWDDVASAAKLHRPADSVDFQEGWVNGFKQVVES